MDGEFARSMQFAVHLFFIVLCNVSCYFGEIHVFNVIVKKFGTQ